MAAVGEVLFVIKGDTTKLSHALDQANKRMRKFSASAARVAKIAGAAAAAATVGLGVLTAKTMQAIDAQSKLASSLNTTSASLAVLQRAADLSGVENMNGMLNIFNRQIGEAASGIGPASEALERLKLTASQLTALPLDERVKLIGDRINEFVPVAEQAAVASDLFGRSGSAMLNVFRDSGVIDEAKRQVNGFGLAISEVDAAKIEIANDAFSSIKEVIRGFLTQVAIKVAPIVYGIATALQEAAIEGGGFGGAVSAAFNGIVKAIGFVMDAFQGFRVGLKLIQTAFYAVKAVAISVMSSIVTTVDDAINAMKESINEFTAGARWALEKIGIDVNPFETTRSKAAIALEAMAADAKARAGEVKAELDEMASGGHASDRMDAFIAETQAKTEAMAAAIAEQRAALREQAIAEDQLDLGQEQVSQAARTAATSKGADDRVRIAEMEAEAKKLSMDSASDEVLAAIGQFGDKALKASKIAGAAKALVSTYEGAAEALKLPFPQNLAAAAAVTAKGLGLVAAIRGVSKGGGGGSASAGGGGGAVAAQAPRTSQNVAINLQGDNFSRASIMGLINQINEAVDDGAIVRLA